MATTRRAVREYLDTLDEATWGAASPVKPKFISRSDPAAQRTAAHKGHAFFAYSSNYLIDLDHAVIVDVEPSRAIRQGEVGATRTMIERTEERFGLYPERLAADTAYGSAENLAWLVHERGKESHIPMFDHSDRRTGSFQRSEFRYDHDRDLYICLGGKEMHRHRRVYLTPRSVVDKDGFMRSQAGQGDCMVYALKEQAAPGQPARKEVRSVHEGAHHPARALSRSDAYVTLRREQKKIEMLFAHLKRILRLDWLRLQGPNGARDEFLLAATARNLRKVDKLLPIPVQASIA